jgi:hypothetical protein
MLSAITAQIQIVAQGRLIYFIVLVIILALSMWIGPKLNVEIRRVPALDAIDEAVGVCAELGSPLLYSFGSMMMSSGVGASYVNGSLQTMKYTANKCAVAGVRMFRYTVDPRIFTMMQDFAEQGALEAGHAEAYLVDDGYYCASAGQVNLQQAAHIESARCASYVGIGSHVGAFEVVAFESVRRVHRGGGFCICGNAGSAEAAIDTLIGDYTLMGDEVAAAGAVLGGDPVALATLLGQDVTTFLNIALLGVAMILYVTTGYILIVG